MKHPFIVRLCLVISIFSFFILSYPKLTTAQSSTLENLSALTSTEGLSQNATFSISFVLPLAATTLSDSDYIHIDLPNYANVTAATLVGGSPTGTPSFSAAGTRVSVTGITLAPGKSITIEGFTADNPASSSLYTLTVSITEDQAGLIVKNTGTVVPVENPGSVTVTATLDIPQARLQISGYSSPQAYVIYTIGDNAAGTDVAALGTGVFSKIFPSLAADTYNFNIYSIDGQNRVTSVYPLSIFTPVNQTTTVSNILLSPTLEINNTTVLQGSDIYATGSAVPGGQITIFTDSPLRTYTASASAAGAWTTTISDTENYTPGDYQIYTIGQTLGGLQSLTSTSILFSISTDASSSGTACGNISHGDLNCDDIVNLTDFSILMYYWGTTNATADMNNDDIVDLTDFSIMMFYWGT